MKNNTQKILIGVLALTLVIVIGLVIFIKTDRGNANSEGSDGQNQYTQSDEMSANSQAADTLSHQHEEDGTASQSGKDDSDETKKEAVSNSDSHVKNDASYKFTDAEIIQSQKSSFGDVKLLTANVDGKKVILFEATVKDKKFYYEFPIYYNIENIYYANVDGYFGDEIIIHANTGGNGGAGSYDNIILKITENGIINLFDDEAAFKFLTSFKTELKDDFNVEITNKYTSFKKTINVKDINSEKYGDSYWETDGKLAVIKTSNQVCIDETFYVFQPKDTDSDGYYEIVCYQYASLGSLTSNIGSTQLTLKYDRDSKQFFVSGADFYLPVK